MTNKEINSYLWNKSYALNMAYKFRISHSTFQHSTKQPIKKKRELLSWFFFSKTDKHKNSFDRTAVHDSRAISLSPSLEVITDLCKHMTRRKSHLFEIRWIPRWKNNTTIIWIVLYFINYTHQLIKSFSRVIGMHICVSTIYIVMF